MTEACAENRRVVERWLPLIAAALAVLGAAFGAAVLPGPALALAPVLAVGLLVQLAVTVLLSRLDAYPHLGLGAVVVVAVLLLAIDSPWRTLVTEQAVLWIPFTLTWFTSRVVQGARTPRQLQISGAVVLVYLLAVGTNAAFVERSVVAATLGAAAPILGGMTVSLAGRLRQARRDRVAALARERAAVARQARESERQQLAAEIHDTLGHLLTLLVLHANALAVTTADRDARQAAEQMSRLGTDGLTELRQLLDLLGAPSRASLAVPTLDELIGEARAAGQAVHLETAGDVADLSPALARTVHQVVREGLTNARKHASGAEVHVGVTVAEAVEVSVRNGPGAAGSSPGNGLGLESLRRRIALLGGSCEHTPTADGGYALRASLPVGSSTGVDERDNTWTLTHQP
ncbi:histidine kinase [Saccharopolyspora sp. K220]|uniref:sensor histidine kinase n=1 Tax=Saccharopolyspora soli TaxID=2926618 RepID=UPI001F5949BE|nr:histidine kinase [Saccharopolyspora soli]MCI2422449.1 histidine kinase [Saccharopolyspora soli]